MSLEIAVIGGGLAGVAAACALAQKGCHIVVLDPRSTYPAVFKAEKIHQQQVTLMSNFGLLERLIPFSAPIREVHASYDGRAFQTSQIQQYGISYQDMVNGIRAQLPPTVEFRQARVESIVTCDDVQRVRLAGGEEISARLVVVACGGSPGLSASLNMHRRFVKRHQSLVFGFSTSFWH